MFQVESVEQWIGQAVVDADGERVGKLAEVFFDVRVGAPTIGVVKLHRRKHQVLAPLAGAVFARGHLRLPYPADVLRSAPRLDASGLIHREDEVVVGQHYSVRVPDDDGSDGTSYQSSEALLANRQAAADAAARAAALEAQADEKLASVVTEQATATQAAEQADAAERDRRRLLSEAEALRRGAPG